MRPKTDLGTQKSPISRKRALGPITLEKHRDIIMSGKHLFGLDLGWGRFQLNLFEFLYILVFYLTDAILVGEEVEPVKVPYIQPF